MSNKSLRMLKASVSYYFGYGGSLKGAIKFYMADRDSQRLPARMRKRIICDAYITHKANTAIANILKVDSKILSSMASTPRSDTSIFDSFYGVEAAECVIHHAGLPEAPVTGRDGTYDGGPSHLWVDECPTIEGLESIIENDGIFHLSGTGHDEVSIKYMHEVNNQLVEGFLNNYLQYRANATKILTSAGNLDDTLFNNLAGIDKADDSLC